MAGTGAQLPSGPDVCPGSGAGHRGAGERARRWAGTMTGQQLAAGVRQAHAGDDQVAVGPVEPFDREAREQAEELSLAPGATRSAWSPARRARPEQPDELRTCFEQDRDRILHSAAFRRLAGKTQVFVFPADHQRTRLTHALEVAQVATAISRACRLNLALTEAIALGHDCGHGPGGHASEDAFGVFVPGFDHAVWGADVTAGPMNLCVETLDGIRNHSWSRPSPATPEGQVVGLADRVAYCAHDLEDAAVAGLVDPADLPAEVAERCGVTRSAQLHAFVTDIVATVTRTGLVGMSEPMGEALARLRAFNHERIYLRAESVAQGRSVIDMLQALVEHLIRHPADLPAEYRRDDDPRLAAVAYVDGMTDRYACATAVSLLGWPAERLPRGQDVG
ncbi:MAG TPA: HD domain-containing protein [Acidimicrobiales bacterium]|nr:HD domain-containing protein [Acidimicrobiales bacterium]